jgi:hypothetical protein
MRGLLVRGGAVWQLVGLITRRSQVQILPPLPIFISRLKSIVYLIYLAGFPDGALPAGGLV